MHWLTLGALVVAVFLYYSIENFSTNKATYQTDDLIIASAEEQQNVRILFTGDVFLGRDVERRNTGTAGSLPLQIFSSFSDLDALIINFESAVPEIHQPTPDFGMQFSVHTRFIPLLAEAGVTHAGLANNHAFDYGVNGYEDTKQIFKKYDIQPFGHPVNLNESSITYVKSDQTTVAIVAIHTLFTQPEIEVVNDILSRANEQADFLVVYVHWGDEYQLNHNQVQEAFADKLVKAGADLIIGHHPHVVQGIHLIDNVPVLYSLGNTIFDQYFSIDVQEGLLVELVIGDDDNYINLHPITSVGTLTRPRKMDLDESRLWLSELTRRSDEILKSQIENRRIYIISNLHNQY